MKILSCIGILSILSAEPSLPANTECLFHYVKCHKSFDNLGGLTKASLILKEIDNIEEHSKGMLETCQGAKSLWYGNRYLKFTYNTEELFKKYKKYKKPEKENNVKNNE